MSDLIDREDLVNGIYSDNPRDVLMYIVEFPSAEPVSQFKWERDVAIDQLKKLGYELGEKPKNGKWINHGCDDGHHIADCNLCGETMQWWDEDVPNFCPNCGADMRGGDAE